jgi:hypothetical protein
MAVDARCTLVRLLARVSAWQSYGTSQSPERFDVALAAPARKLTGRLHGGRGHAPDGRRARGPRPGPELPARWRARPPGASPGGRSTPRSRSSPCSRTRCGRPRSSARHGSWPSRPRCSIFRIGSRGPATACFRRVTTAAPSPPSFRLPAAKVTGWPPGPLSVPTAEAASGEGEWTSPIEAPAGEADGPPVLRTFVRVDPERPYERVYLFAFDMRRLGLHFIGGTSDPRSTTGARGVRHHCTRPSFAGHRHLQRRIQGRARRIRGRRGCPGDRATVSGTRYGRARRERPRPFWGVGPGRCVATGRRRPSSEPAHRCSRRVWSIPSECTTGVSSCRASTRPKHHAPRSGSPMAASSFSGGRGPRPPNCSAKPCGGPASSSPCTST